MEGDGGDDVGVAEGSDVGMITLEATESVFISWLAGC